MPLQAYTPTSIVGLDTGDLCAHKAKFQNGRRKVGHKCTPFSSFGVDNLKKQR